MRKSLAILLLCLTLCMFFCSCEKWGDAPDFTMYDTSENAYKLSSFAGKGIVLNFFASWCGPCKNEMPAFQRAYEEYGSEVQFLMVNLTGWEYNLYDGKEYIESTSYTFPVYYDLEGTASYVYDFDSIPRTIFIDKNGNISDKHTGMLSYDGLIKGIEKIK